MSEHSTHIRDHLLRGETEELNMLKQMLVVFHVIPCGGCAVIAAMIHVVAHNAIGASITMQELQALVAIAYDEATTTP